MATFSSVFSPSQGDASTTSVAATTSSADIVIGFNRIFRITCGGDCTIRFGTSSNIANAAATDFPLWSKAYMDFETGSQCDRIRVYNTTAGAVNVSVLPLVR